MKYLSRTEEVLSKSIIYFKHKYLSMCLQLNTNFSYQIPVHIKINKIKLTRKVIVPCWIWNIYTILQLFTSYHRLIFFNDSVPKITSHHVVLLSKQISNLTIRTGVGNKKNETWLCSVHPSNGNGRKTETRGEFYRCWKNELSTPFKFGRCT